MALELPIQLTRLPVHPSPGSSSKPTDPTAAATGRLGFKLSVTAPRTPALRCCLVFRNFYVAWIRIVQVNVDGTSTELTAAYPLMHHVHCEDDAQDWQTVHLDELPVSWNPLVLDSLSIYLFQPSPLWETWELRQVKLYAIAQEEQELIQEAQASTQRGAANPSKWEKRTSTSRAEATEDRLAQLLEHRSSRTALTRTNSVAEAANPVEEQATHCLDMILRLQELL